MNIRAPDERQRYKAKSTSEYDTGFKIAGTAGYEFDGGLRVEGELFFARAGVDKVTYSGVPMVGKVDVPDLRHRRPARWLRECLVRHRHVAQLDTIYRRRNRLRPGRPGRPGLQLQHAVPHHRGGEGGPTVCTEPAPCAGDFDHRYCCSLTTSAPGSATGLRTTSSSRRAIASSPRAILSSRRRTTRVPST